MAATQRLEVKTAYIFVTNQPFGAGHDTDSVHLFEILQLWFSRELPNLALKVEEIPNNIKAIDEDGLLNYYYQFFNRTISSNSTILISIKGGTPQMQTALKMQAISSSAQRQLFVEPILSIKKFLAGEPSDYQMKSHWRYMRSQKYLNVNLLLEQRWDFDGAKQILLNWQDTLQFLIKENVVDKNVAQSSQNIELVIAALDVGLHYFNLDNYSVEEARVENPNLPAFSSLNNLDIDPKDLRLLNLYTQCRIYWELDQVANFLARMSSFYEETLFRLVEICRGENFFDNWRSGKWYLNTEKMRNQMGDKLWQYFRNAEWNENERFRNHNFNTKSMFQLMGRPTKLHFVEALMRYRQIPQAQQEVLNLLRSLDYWARIRNDLVHGAKGVSKVRMSELLDNDRRYGNVQNACDCDDILKVMAAICQSDLGIISENYRRKFVGDKAEFYIYSYIKSWVNKQLADEIKQ